MNDDQRFRLRAYLAIVAGLTMFWTTVVVAIASVWR